jgi:divalent metal cation (Fe/Co/Zn/Cd) transporter
VDTPWGEALSENLWVFAILLIVAAAIFFAVRWSWPKLPKADWTWSFDADAHPEETPPTAPTTDLLPSHWRHGLVEKIVLVSLISIIFGQMLPNTSVSNLQMATGMAIIIAINAFVSHWLAARGTHWRSILTEFAAMAGINFAVALGLVLLSPSLDGEVELRSLLFFVVLLTLIVTLYDRYRPFYDRRVTAEAEAAAAPE